MINNFDTIVPLLDFSDPDLFYYGQVIRRRKDWGNGGMEVGAQVIKVFEFHSQESMQRQWPFLKNLANSNMSRIYINLNRRSKKVILHRLNLKLANRILSGGYDGLAGDYASTLRKWSSEPRSTKKWLIDVDVKSELLMIKLGFFLKEVGSNIYCIVPTAQGCHVIAQPFPLINAPKLQDVDFKKDNPTLLYYKFGENDETF